MPDPMAQLFATLAALGNRGENPLGMSPQAQVTGQGLDAYAQAGEQPPMPGGDGMPAMIQLLTMLSAMQNGAGDTGVPQPAAPSQGQSLAGELQNLNSPTSASANSPQMKALKQALLLSSIAE